MDEIRHEQKFGTEYTLCGEEAVPRDYGNHPENVTCEICIRQRLEGEIDFIKNLNRSTEDRILNAYFILAVILSAVIIVLFVLLPYSE